MVTRETGCRRRRPKGKIPKSSRALDDPDFNDYLISFVERIFDSVIGKGGRRRRSRRRNKHLVGQRCFIAVTTAGVVC